MAFSRLAELDQWREQFAYELIADRVPKLPPGQPLTGPPARRLGELDDRLEQWDTGTQTRLMHVPGQDVLPAFSPGYEQVVWTTNREGQGGHSSTPRM